MSQHAELISFLETQPQPHILFDRHYRILAVNGAFRQHCDGDNNVIGRTCYEVSHHFKRPCDQAGETCPLTRSLRSGQLERDLHLHHTPHGEQYVSIELTPIRDPQGAIVCFVERMEALNTGQAHSTGQGMVGRAPAFQAMLGLLSRVAPAEAVVLLEGESGTGKELAAHAIHASSRRASAAFIAVDCSGIPETLFESELFGHERGAFTGATARKQGLVEVASGGTLFLDEVGEIPLSMQVKLLRLLETGTYRRVGSTEIRRADIRVIAATHRKLQSMVAEERFRADLFYRLNVFPIRVPALRERMDDLPLLVDTLLAWLAPERKLSLSPAALHALQAHAFPGNVRELRNILERAILMCDGPHILPEHLLLPEPASFQPQEMFATLDDAELQRLLKEFRGSRKALAARLGMSERTLYRRIKELSPQPPSQGRG